ncbi:MAG: amidohydrolase family protein [Deltaproteobacteria bacterium]|nr:amidohydrolase family protein [Deltaproteobacteria bacterium]
MNNNHHLILAGWLVDGSGEHLKHKVILSILDGIITAIEPFNSSELPPASKFTDLSHCCVLPPLVDSHVHLCMSGSVDKELRTRQLEATYEDSKPIISKHISDHFSHGILAVRDAGDPLGSVLRFMSEKQKEPAMPVKISSAGRAWHQRKRYGSLIGRHPAEGESLDKAYIKDKSLTDYVKLINSGLNSLTVFNHQTSPQFTLEEMKAAISHAEDRGLKVMVHANGILPVQMALRAGAHSIEHGFFMGKENLEAMAESQTFWVPTAYTMKAYRQCIDYSLHNAEKAVVEKNLAHQIEQIEYARKCGVRIALGTDSGSIGVLHGEALVEELKIFMQAGFSLVQAMRCATYNGSKLLGVEKELGHLAVGKPATFLVTRGTPAQLPRKLSYLEAIYIDGKPCQAYRR